MSTKMYSIESRFVIIMNIKNMLFAGVYVCTFQSGNFTGWGSEGINGHCPCSDLTSSMLWSVLTGTVCPVIFTA